MEKSVAQQEYDHFTDSFSSLLLSTVDRENAPLSSYATFIEDRDEKQFYTLISDIAEHSQNINENKKASIMFIEDESSCENIFARKRLIYKCDVNRIGRESLKFEELRGEYIAKYGEIVAMLLSMQDFNFYMHKPYYANFVLGFGAAFEAEAPNFTTLKTRTDIGHRR